MRYSGLLICAVSVIAFGFFAILPVSGDHLYNSGEIVVTSRLALSAKNAILEGQLFLRYANDFEVVLQPVFLYYTPVAFWMAGLMQSMFELDAYNSLLILIT